ncbi:MAG: CehA/McbA family metallohydrolase [Planctomycetota bacterium]
MRLTLLIAFGLLLTGALTCDLTAHPDDHLTPGRLAAQKRVPMRKNSPQRLAPDNQTEPLPVGTRPTIPPDQHVTLEVSVVDADTGAPLPHRVHIDDADGTYYPPRGHFDIEPPNSNSNNVSYEPDTTNDGYDWAMIPETQFIADVPAHANIQMKFSRGLEYPIQTVTLDLSNKAGQTVQHTVRMKRGANMRAKGWMAADTHVHNLTPLGAIRQMPVEAIDYVNLMFIGPGHPLLRRGYVTGQPADVSTKDHIVYVSQEVRDANQGHMTLVGITNPIQPIRTYTGVEKVIRLPALPNEPLNWEVHDNLHAQGGLAFHAHYLFWPGWGSAVGAAIDKLDGLEWLSVDTENRGDRTRQNIEVPGFGKRAGGRMWYDMLNCGARLPIVGGTDKMSAGRVVGGASRTYVKVPEWTHEGFMDGMAAGRTFVTNGPLLLLTANGKTLSEEIQLEGDGPFTVNINAECFTQKSIKYLELIVNGEVTEQIRVAADQKEIQLDKKLNFKRSGWIALRARHDRSHPDNWHHGITAAHTSPIYVTVNDQPPAVKASAKYMVARLEATIRWANTEAMWSSDAYKNKALTSFRLAKVFYETALQRAQTTK